MTLAEALAKNGRAKRSCWDKYRPIIIQDCGLAISIDDAIATDWQPYEDPPKEKRLRRSQVNDGPCTVSCEDHPPIWREMVEVSPERDAIVEAAVAWVRGIDRANPNPLSTTDWRITPSTKAIEDAVEAWVKSGSPS